MYRGKMGHRGRIAHGDQDGREVLGRTGSHNIVSCRDTTGQKDGLKIGGVLNNATQLLSGSER